jgi:hypothetical protein
MTGYDNDLPVALVSAPEATGKITEVKLARAAEARIMKAIADYKTDGNVGDAAIAKLHLAADVGDFFEKHHAVGDREPILSGRRKPDATFAAFQRAIDTSVRSIAENPHKEFTDAQAGSVWHDMEGLGAIFSHLREAVLTAALGKDKPEIIDITSSTASGWARN